ncbi:MAG: mitochondrial import inner membrane translocase subunit tim21 [Stictis urceolatum]|nr:mitochondrial import inner membrane translocase subunit tim21 [Stictis urceolata]
MPSIVPVYSRALNSAPCTKSLPVIALNSLARRYASSSSKRRQVTVANDDGRVAWSDLSTREKAARTTQQTFNFGLVIVGIVMTGGVSYFLYDAVFSSDSKVSHFNRAFEEIKASPRARELIGPSNKMKAYGENTWNRWTRNRAIASTITKDGYGRDNLLLNFYVEGPNGKGRVNVHMVRPEGGAHFEYKKLTLDVPGNKTIFLRNTDTPQDARKGFKFLGVEWK